MNNDKKTKKSQYCNVVLRMNHYYRNIYARQFKAHNTLIIQLKTEKIKFNQFLHER